MGLALRFFVVAMTCAVGVWACGGDDDGGGGANGGSSANGGASANGGSSGSSASGGTSGGGGTAGTEPVPVDPGAYTYQLEESTSALTLWTTPATRKPRTADRAPTVKHSGLKLSAAKNEFEPALLLLGPASGNVSVAVAKFPNLGSSQRVEVSVARYEQGWAERLEPLSSGGSVALSNAEGTPIWISVYVPKDAPPGDHTTTLTLTPAAGSPISVPVTLYVFDFALPDQIHFASQLNLSVAALVGGGSVEQAKTLLFEHRFTPSNSAWPSGFGWNITWENSSSPTQCSAFFDEPNEAAEYSIGKLARRYLLGEGWNGVGFPDSMLFGFVDNSTPRPDSFCGVARGDHYGTSAYNAEWSDFLAGLDGYLTQNGYAERSYYYVQNEPQNAEDYKLAAHLCRLTKAAAPNLRIAVSEEPKPEIAEEAGGACGYDIWIAHIRAYQEAYAWQRQRDHAELVWFYSLDQDPDPYFNPTRVDRDGVHARIIPWAAWSHRIRGWAYYDAGRFFSSGVPGVRAELLREGFEDYEYLWLSNGKAHPRVDMTEPADATAKSVAASMQSFTKDADALAALRHELGRYIEGSRPSFPVLQGGGGPNPKAAYYVNFQDPNGAPTANPLVIDGKTYIKVGWDAYDTKQGYGWSGEFIGDPAIALSGYDDVAGYSELQKSFVYDDYGRDNLFEFALVPGKYQVTVGAGRPARGYPGDPHNVSVEGQRIIDDVVTTDAEPTIERTVTLDITDGSLSLVAGGLSASTGNYAYTFLAFLRIEPLD